MDNSPEFFYSDPKCGDHFVIEDLLVFPAEEGAAAVDGGTPPPMDLAGTSCNSSSSAAEMSGAVGGHFTEFCIPYEDLAELEWVSNFAEESFSNEDLQRLHLIQGITVRTGDQTTRTEVSIPGKARSKRSRAPGNGNWTSRLLAATAGPGSESGPGGEGRRCLHCATETTPQWRAGPMGPKTLCNACGVRYKSGRLVPEYRPASSPTFVLTKHSNSHRKVVELRRQKETVRAQQQRQEFLSRNTMFDEDHMIHHFRRMV